MVSPARIRSERKQALRIVKKALKAFDSPQEKLQRQIERVLQVKKRYPNEDDAISIITQIQELDKLLDSVVSAANDFKTIVVQV